jgi:hypothetical protein
MDVLRLDSGVTGNVGCSLVLVADILSEILRGTKVYHSRSGQFTRSQKLNEIFLARMIESWKTHLPTSAAPTVQSLRSSAALSSWPESNGLVWEHRHSQTPACSARKEDHLVVSVFEVWRGL